MKIRLIFPRWEALELRDLVPSPHPDMALILAEFERFSETCGYALLILAALTPSSIDVDITDDFLEEIDYNEDVDLVGITAMTPQAYRAYEISDRFREKGVPVILGGIHPSLLPEEAIQHADSVLIGEAENLWEKVLDDFQNKRLKKIYKSEEKPDLTSFPLPRRELLKNKPCKVNIDVQPTRGCIYGCTICNVPTMYGKKVRYRKLENVIEEMKTVNSDEIFLIEELTWMNPQYKEYYEKLFKMMIPLKVKFTTQTTTYRNIYVAGREFLELMKKAGCIAISFTQDEYIFDYYNKEKQSHLKKITQQLKDIGIPLLQYFYLGTEIENKDIFSRALEYAKQSGIRSCLFFNLIPFPKTPFYDQLEKEGRLLTKDWSKYTGKYTVHSPKNMTSEELQEGVRWLWKEFYK